MIIFDDTTFVLAVNSLIIDEIGECANHEVGSQLKMSNVFDKFCFHSMLIGQNGLYLHLFYVMELSGRPL